MPYSLEWKICGQAIRAPASLKFSLATVIGNVKEKWQISLFPLATEVLFWQFCGHFD
jgi:hypothetical protein